METRVYIAVFVLSSVMAESCPPGYVIDPPSGINSCQKCNLTGCICSNYQNCKGCMEGYFMGQYTCSQCPNGCLTCTNTTTCTSCKTGYTGTNCDALVCASDTCKCKNIGKCDACLDGYYDTPNNCTYNCNSNCSSCSDNITCDSCKPGLYGKVCGNTCSNGCNNTTCNKTDGSCSCAPNFVGEKCAKCIPGMYGHSCEHSCSNGCNTTVCNTDGSCECSEDYMGERCDQCQLGRYGISCEHVCSNGCNTTCNQTDGTCSCSKNFTGDKCNECATGMYGESCELNCSRGCNGTCNRTDGICSCLKHFTDSMCDKCEAGWYDFDCENACSLGCKDTCKPLDGTCNCLGNFTGDKCESCLNGIYGIHCNIECSEGCVDRLCDRTNGTCTCVDNFTGYNCERCVSGMYGSSCELTCSRGCNSPGCNRTDGSCTCLEGFTGLKCDECTPDRYGSACRLSCSQGCANRTCNSTDGSCICSEYFTGDKCDKCVPGKYGSFCELFCSQGCVPNECNGHDGNCSCSGNFTGAKCDRCVQGKYGEICTFQCPSGCLKNLCNRIGECSDGCFQHFFGDICNQTCPVNCNNGTSTISRCERTSGRCQFGCSKGLSGYTCETAIETTSYDELPIAAIAGGAGGGGFAMFMLGLLAFCLIRKRIPHPPTENDNLLELNGLSDVPVYATVQRNHSERNTHNADVTDSIHAISNDATVNQQSWHTYVHLHPPIPSPSLADEDGLEIDENEDEARLRAIKFEEQGGVYYNCASKLEKSKIRVSELTEFVNSKDKNYFEEEFEKLPKGMTKKYDVSQMTLNMPMNRYRGIYPYDDSRVKVHGGVTDYINASYIDGYKQRNAYIATLGPMSKQLGDFSPFWRMIWQHKVDKIVMVTNFVEEEKDKCEKYFPDVGLTQTYGEIFVKCTSEDEYTEFVRRIFIVSLDNAERTLYHFHFTAWPDKGIPEDVTSIVEFRESVLNTPTVMGGPTVVHCSAGIGRSGTYIALDILIREGEAENMVDIPGCVVNMRHNRPHMVQTAEQYEYLHHALVHALTLGCKPEDIDDCPRL